MYKNCRKKTDTILRTTVSMLPNMSILFLKRFDPDYTAFETVKLNNHYAFPETLNIKKYTLEGQDAYEDTRSSDDANSPIATETDDSEDKMDREVLMDKEYQYRLVGVLVHTGVAQGGHYIAFSKTATQDRKGSGFGLMRKLPRRSTLP